jgi:hypothetical protein
MAIRHAGTEPVATLANQIAWLECTLHKTRPRNARFLFSLPLEIRPGEALAARLPGSRGL